MLVDFQTKHLHSWHHAFLHLDADCFFVAAEMSINPALKGKNIVVGKEIVLAKSYSAKKWGVTTGMHIGEAKRICPNLIILGTNFDLYTQLSKKIFRIISNYSNQMEVNSIDEAYLDLSGISDKKEDYYQIANNLKSEIKKKIDLDVSIGISTTKTLAKLFSDLAKPSGILVVSQNEINKLIKPIKLSQIAGFGRSTIEKFKKFGMQTVEDFYEWNPEIIIKRLGKSGFTKYLELKGVSVCKLKQRSAPKSIMKSRSFQFCHNRKEEIKANLINHLSSACLKLKKHNLETCQITLMLRLQDFSEEIKTIQMESYNQDQFLMESLLIKVFEDLFDTDKSYRSVGVILDDLRDSRVHLLAKSNKSSQIANKMAKVFNSQIDLSRRYGKNILVRGLEIGKNKQKTIRRKFKYEFIEMT